jgi:hypothetical protein
MPRERNNALKPTLPSAPSAGRSPIGMHVSSTAAGCSLGVCKSGGDSALGDLVLAFEALGVDAEQDLDLHDLIPEGVGVVELHDSAPWPAAVSRRPGIALHRGHLVTPARQRGAHEQAGGAQSDDGYSHDDQSIRYTSDAFITSIVQLT